MNLIKTSKNKNQFFLKKSQRTVEVVLTLFILLIPIWLQIKTKTNKNKQINRKAILEEIISFRDILFRAFVTPGDLELHDSAASR